MTKAQPLLLAGYHGYYFEGRDLPSYLNGAEVTAADWHPVEAPDVPFPVVMRLGRAPDGNVICTGLLLRGPVTAGSLRKIRLGLMLDELTQFMGQEWLGSLEGVQRPTRMGPRGIPRERLAEIAALYRQALRERPSAPVKWLSERVFGPDGKPTPVVTVRRYLQRCRDLGLLGPSIPGRAGEQPPTTKKRRQR